MIPHAPRSRAELDALVTHARGGGDCEEIALALLAALATPSPHALQMQSVAALLRLSGRLAPATRAQAAAAIEQLAAALAGPPQAVARAAAFFVDGRAAELVDALAAGDQELLLRHSAQAYAFVTTLPRAAPALFARWIDALRASAPHVGSTAFRAFLGDVCEAAFRSLQRGADAEALLGEAGRAFLVDMVCAELPGSTDFLAARAMAWLVGTLAPGDETARAAIERARARFSDPGFLADCRAMLAQDGWPPPGVL